MRAPRVRIVIDGVADRVIEVDGVNLASVVSDVNVLIKPGYPPRVTLVIYTGQLELEGAGAEMIIETFGDATVIGVTEHGDLVHEAPDDGKVLAETVARKLPDVLAKKGCSDVTLQARLEYIIGWLHTIAWRRGYGDPGRVPWLICRLRDWEDRRCYLVPVGMARFGLLELDGKRIEWRIRSRDLEGDTITVLPSERFQHDTPAGTYRIRRWAPGRASWLVYR